MLKRYYTLVKPGIVYGNLFTALAGFLFASKGHIDLWLLLAALAGIALVVASACVFNNYTDRDIDKKMLRTRERGLASRAISVRSALIYASVLGIVGFVLLLGLVNILTAALILGGFVSYVVVYAVAKRSSHWGTVAGSIPGAVPIVAGYAAVVDKVDASALILFIVLVLWQMPHFYAIAIYRLEEYKEAHIPVLPAVKGIRAAKIHIVWYIAAFTAGAVSLAALHYVNYIYLSIMLCAGLAWFGYALYGFKAIDDMQWARRLFLYSLVVLVVFCAALAYTALYQV